jgi:hypothetical protein
MLAYSNNGISFRRVPNDYQAQQGEALFPDDPLPTPAQLSAAFAGYAPAVAANAAAQAFPQKLVAGLAIVSTATPALNATYPIDSDAQSKLAAIVTGISAGKGLPHGASTVQWPDITGAFHSFLPADIVNLGAAIEAYVYDLILTESALIGGKAATWPAGPITIA